MVGTAFNASFLHLQPGTQGKALAQLERWHKAAELKGTLAGCWYAEIGALNRVIMIHAYSGPGGMSPDRDKVLDSADPYGLGDMLISYHMDAYQPFPGFDTPLSGRIGPYFEIRQYRLKTTGLKPVLDAWGKALEARQKISPLMSVMYARGGTMPRFMHIWPYATLDQRMALRAKAVEMGVWPPPGGIVHIAEMQSEIYMPASFSPAQ